MTEAFFDALKDSLAMLPLLFVIYAALELVERRYEHAVKRTLISSFRLGPLLGALFGCIPQCGFSVIAAALYAQGVISTGTLLAVFLSTSDEAVPVILAQPEKAGLVLPILGTKILVALTAGYIVDLAANRSTAPRAAALDENHLPHECSTEHGHCCGRSHKCEEVWWKSFFIYPAKHSIQIFFFIFAVSLAINLAVFQVGEENLDRIFMTGTLFQPFIAVLIGLIPNCAASVAITQIFLKGGITFGSAIAGLSASAGLGTLVLIRENKDPKDTLRVLGLLIAASFLAGVLINLF